MELRTYNIRKSGNLVLATDEAREAEEFLTDNPGHHLDDFTATDVKQRAKDERQAEKEAAKQVEQAQEDYEKAIEDRVKELTADPEILATAVAEIEHQRGLL